MDDKEGRIPTRIVKKTVNFELPNKDTIIEEEEVEEKNGETSSVDELRINFYLDDPDDGRGGVYSYQNDYPNPSQSPSDEEDNNGSCRRRTTDILLELLSLLFTTTDMTFVAVLVYRHYMEGNGHEEGGEQDALRAWAMLLPIFLSTFGVQLFFEKYPPRRHWYNEILNIPLVGPIFCTGELLYARWSGSDASEETHRIEAESIKLKQYESIFRAYPEGVVMLSVLLINRTEVESSRFLENWIMEVLCVTFAVLCLAESHWYGIVSDFYRIHDRSRPSLLNHHDIQRPGRLYQWQRFLLFIHAVFAIGLRTFCEGLIRATLYFILNTRDGGKVTHTIVEVLLIVFFAEMGVRAFLHLIAQIIREVSVDCYKYLLNPFYEPQYRRRRGCAGGYTRIDTRALDGTFNEDDEAGGTDLGESFEGIHGAVRWGLLSSFSPLQFQSKYLPTVLWFYVENLCILILWFVGTRTMKDKDDTFIVILYDQTILITAMLLFFLSILFQTIVSYLTEPESTVCVVRIRRVPQRYIMTFPSFPSAAYL